MTLFFSMGLASLISIGLYNAASGWFPVQSDVSDTNTSDSTSMTRTEEYVNAQLDNYLWVLVGISIFGIILNLLSPVKNFVERLKIESVDDDAASASTPPFKKDHKNRQIRDCDDTTASQHQIIDSDDVSETLPELEKTSGSVSTSESISLSTSASNSNMEL